MEAGVVRILGLGRKPKSLLDVAQDIEKGLPARSIDHLKAALQLTDEEVSSTLGVSPKTISRALASSVFGDNEQAREWLRSPQIGLGNLVPLHLLTTGAGAREVEDLLGRIEHGVLS